MFFFEEHCILHFDNASDVVVKVAIYSRMSNVIIISCRYSIYKTSVGGCLFEYGETDGLWSSLKSRDTGVVST